VSLVICSAAGCGHQEPAVEREVPSFRDTLAADVLWLPRGAVLRDDISSAPLIKDGRSIYKDGSGHVSFTIDTADVNPEQVSASLIEHFAGTDWQQRPNQYMNPHMPTSFKDGWRDRCACVLVLDEQGNPIHRHAYEWVGEWQNARGDVVGYHLNGVNDELHAYASYTPHRIVDFFVRRRGR
jgi:hypothetical protein